MKPLALLLLFALAAPDAHAKCAMSGLRPTVVTPASTAIPEGGGIVVAAETEVGNRELSEGDVAVQQAWRFKHGKLLVEPAIDVIAPGLAVYRYPATADVLELEDGKHAVLARVTMTKDKPALLPAPKVKQLVSTKLRGRRSSTTVAVQLDGAAPAGAIAIVAVDAKGKPLAFGRIAAGEPVFVYKQHRCEIVANGTVEPRAGERISLFWVDGMGRRSPATKPIAVIGKRTKDAE